MNSNLGKMLKRIKNNKCNERRLIECQKNVELFYEKVNTDVGLKEQLHRLLDYCGKNLWDKFIQIAEENGFLFTAEDMKAYEEEVIAGMIESGEISEEELETVSGGHYLAIDQVILYPFERILKVIKKAKNNPLF